MIRNPLSNGLLHLISVPPPLSNVEDVPFLPALKIKDKNKITFTPEDFQNIRVGGPTPEEYGSTP